MCVCVCGVLLLCYWLDHTDKVKKIRGAVWVFILEIPWPETCGGKFEKNITEVPIESLTTLSLFTLDQKKSTHQFDSLRNAKKKKRTKKKRTGKYIDKRNPMISTIDTNTHTQRERERERERRETQWVRLSDAKWEQIRKTYYLLFFFFCYLDRWCQDWGQ